MILREEYHITPELYSEAFDYARSARAYTSNRHDFHNGGLSNKQQKMFEGKLGEKGFKMFLLENNVPFIEDHSSPQERDEYDFLLTTPQKQLLFDVKTRTKSFHTRTLEMVEQAQSHPKDIFISARLFSERNVVKLLGWYSFQDMINIGQIENNGNLDNYVMYDSELRSIKELYDLILSSCI